MAKESVLTKVGLLLRSNKSDEADELLASESNRIERQIAELKGKIVGLESELSAIHQLMPEGGQQSLLRGIPEPVKLTESQKRERREAILQVANELGDEKSTIASEDVARVLRAKGVPMGVQASRVNTAIGAVLRSHGDFEKVPGEALFRKRVRNVSTNVDDKETETVVPGGIQ